MKIEAKRRLQSNFFDEATKIDPSSFRDSFTKLYLNRNQRFKVQKVGIQGFSGEGWNFQADKAVSTESLEELINAVRKVGGKLGMSEVHALEDVKSKQFWINTKSVGSGSVSVYVKD